MSGSGEPNPFLAYRRYLAWDSYAATLGMSEQRREAVVADLDEKVSGVAGTGFVVTPYARAARLSDELGFSDRGGVWIKDETRNVAGSHKARHLLPILLHLVVTEMMGKAPWAPHHRPPLAIASCGNAALAAATLAAAVQWPLEVFVPTDAHGAVLEMLRSLDARVVVCPRPAADRAADLAGDPCLRRFRDAVDAGAVPFGAQGTENGWCLDGGRTIGWEIAEQSARDRAAPDRVFVQVGGGALAACLTAGLDACGSTARIEAVQTAACAPLHRAWVRWSAAGQHADAGWAWSEYMWPWQPIGRSAADGILDDETYDWLPVVSALAATGGRAVVVAEADVLRANALAAAHTSIDASHTATAGLAGVLARRSDIGRDERVAVILSGIRRS